MAPLPKRRHSSRRQAKRTRALQIKRPNLVTCSNCKAPKLPHRVCPNCGFYDSREVIMQKNHKKKRQ